MGLTIRRIVSKFKNSSLKSFILDSVRYAANVALVHVAGLPPRKIGVYNGVAVRNIKLLEQGDVNGDHESPLIDGIRTTVGSGQDVLVIGGGLGVSSVTAAKATGSSGSVISYEGSHHRTEIIKEMIHLNRVDDIVTVEHAVVSEGKNVFLDGSEEAKQIPPTELLDCDILVSDCEGAELRIITERDAEPDTIIVETHGNNESPTNQVVAKLNERGYEVVSKAAENAAKDVSILTTVLAQ